MVLRPIVLNWHREAFAAGQTEDIPVDSLEILKAEAEAKKAKPKQESKKEAE